MSLWWDNLIAGVAVDEEWEENFRISKDSCLTSCDEFLPYIKKTTIMRSPIDVEKQVEITCTLYYLPDEGRLRKTANAFGVYRSSVSIIK